MSVTCVTFAGKRIVFVTKRRLLPIRLAGMTAQIHIAEDRVHAYIPTLTYSRTPLLWFQIWQRGFILATVKGL